MGFGVYIKSVKPDTAAADCGTIVAGMQLLRLNGVDMREHGTFELLKVGLMATTGTLQMTLTAGQSAAYKTYATRRESPATVGGYAIARGTAAAAATPQYANALHIAPGIAESQYDSALQLAPALGDDDDHYHYAAAAVDATAPQQGQSRSAGYHYGAAASDSTALKPRRSNPASPKNEPVTHYETPWPEEEFYEMLWPTNGGPVDTESQI